MSSAPVARDTFARDTAVMSVGTGLSRATGYVRLLATAAALGTVTLRANAYSVANNTPNIVYELILGGVLTSIFVPVFVERMTQRSVSEAWESARAILSLSLVILTAVTVVMMVAAPLIVHVYTISLHGPQAEAERELATFFLRWFMPQIIFYGIGAIATGLLNAHRRFTAPMFAPVLNNVVVIGTMLAVIVLPEAAKTDPDGLTTAQTYVLAIGTTLGVVAMTLALLPSLRATGFRFHWRTAWRDDAVVMIGRLSLWVLLYVAANQVALLTVIILSSKESGYAAYVAAFILFQLPHAIFSVSVMTALLPSMAAKWSERDRPAFADLLGRGLRSTAFIILPAALGYIALAKPITFVTIRHGATTAAQADLVAGILVCFAIGLPFFSAFQLFARVFYGAQNARATALINLVATAINIALNFVLFRVMNVRGLALAFSISYMVAAVFAFAALRWWLPTLDGRGVASSIGRSLLAAVASAAVAFGTSRLIGGPVAPTFAGQLIQVVAGVTAGGAVFLLIARAFRMPEIDILRRFMPDPRALRPRGRHRR